MKPDAFARILINPFACLVGNRFVYGDSFKLSEELKRALLFVWRYACQHFKARDDGDKLIAICCQR